MSAASRLLSPSCSKSIDTSVALVTVVNTGGSLYRLVTPWDNPSKCINYSALIQHPHAVGLDLRKQASR
jgi:hypothetical protein